MDSVRDIAPAVRRRTEPPPGGVAEAFRGPHTLAAWALAAPQDEAVGLRAVLVLAGGPVTAPAREAARLISERHRVEAVRRLAGRVAAALVRVR